MTTPDPPPGAPEPPARVSHRAQPAPRSRVIPIVAAVAVVAALALAGYMLLTSGDDDGGSAGPGTSTGPGTSLTPSASGSHHGSGSAQPTKSGGHGPTKKPTATTSSKPTHKPTHKPSHQQSNQPVPQIPVYVFNQTTTTGLAAQFGSELDVAGWNVVGIDNWRGNVPEDTVYYYPGDRAAAERLSHDFNDIQRVWPASSPMPRGALTVILATQVRK